MAAQLIFNCCGC